MIKLTIGPGSPVEVHKGSLRVEHGCIVFYENKGGLDKLVLAYCLHPGETLRRVEDGVYDVQL